MEATTQCVDYTESVHHVKNKSGELLVGILRKQSSSETDKNDDNLLLIKRKPRPVVVLCHGLACHKNYFIFPKLFDVNFDTYRFDFSGNCESEGEFSYANYDKEVEDVHSIISYLKNDLSYEQISLVGHSKGGNIVLQYANKYPQELQQGIVVNLCGRFNMKNTPLNRFTESEREELERNGSFLWKTVTIDGSLCVGGLDVTRKFHVTRKALEERELVDTKIQLQENFPISVYSIHGDRDLVIPFSDSQQFHEFFKQQVLENEKLKNSHHELIAIDGADHFFVGFYGELENIITQLVKGYYKL